MCRSTIKAIKFNEAVRYSLTVVFGSYTYFNSYIPFTKKRKERKYNDHRHKMIYTKNYYSFLLVKNSICLFALLFCFFYFFFVLQLFRTKNHTVWIKGNERKRETVLM